MNLEGRLFIQYSHCLRTEAVGQSGGSDVNGLVFPCKVGQGDADHAEYYAHDINSGCCRWC